MLFRLEKNPNAHKDLIILGYDWIEVLAIEPFVTVKTKDWGKWADRCIHRRWHIRTEFGCTMVMADDVHIEFDPEDDTAGFEYVYAENLPAKEAAHSTGDSEAIETLRLLMRMLRVAANNSTDVTPELNQAIAIGHQFLDTVADQIVENESRTDD